MDWSMDCSIMQEAIIQELYHVSCKKRCQNTGFKNSVYLCFNCEKIGSSTKSKKKKRKVDDIKKQLEIVFSIDTSTLMMAMEHFKIQ